MDFLLFIFSSFWRWLGFAVLLCVAGGNIANLLNACKPEKRRVVTCRDADRLTVTIFGATAEEAEAARAEVVTAIWDGGGYKLEKSGEEQGNEP